MQSNFICGLSDVIIKTASQSFTRGTAFAARKTDLPRRQLFQRQLQQRTVNAAHTYTERQSHRTRFPRWPPNCCFSAVACRPPCSSAVFYRASDSNRAEVAALTNSAHTGVPTLTPVSARKMRTAAGPAVGLIARAVLSRELTSHRHRTMLLLRPR